MSAGQHPLLNLSGADGFSPSLCSLSSHLRQSQEPRAYPLPGMLGKGRGNSFISFQARCLLGKIKKSSPESCKRINWTLSWGLSGYLKGLCLSPELLGTLLCAAKSGDGDEDVGLLHLGACWGGNSPGMSKG